MADIEGVRAELDSNVCALCGSFENLRICARCGDCYYCSKDHQVTDWKVHKKSCRPKPDDTHPSSIHDSLAESRNNTHDGAEGPRPGAQHQMNVGDQNNYADKLVINSKEEDQREKCTVCSGHAKAAVTVQIPPTGDVGSSSSGERDHGQLKTDKNTKTAPNSDSSQSDSLASGSETHKMGGLNVDVSRDKAKCCQVDSASQGHSNGNSNNRTHSDCTEPSPSPQVKSDSSKRARVKGKRGIRDPAGIPDKIPMSPSKPTETDLSDYVVKCLNDYGLCVVDKFMADSKADVILEEVLTLQRKRALREGQLVDTSSTDQKIRGDQITWVEKGEDCLPTIGELIDRMDSLMVTCNGRLGNHNINGRTKAMVACYPGHGTSYKRHVDNPKGDGRCITCIYYLNKNWDVKKDGGLLRIYPSTLNKVADIEPKFDRLLFFWSDRRNPHEVQPTFRHRFAITVWYFDAEQRKRARIQYTISGMTEGTSYSAGDQAFEVPK